jgi:hypothetical protein
MASTAVHAAPTANATKPANHPRRPSDRARHSSTTIATQNAAAPG